MEKRTQVEVLEGSDDLRLVWRESGSLEIAAILVSIIVVPIGAYLWWRGGWEDFDGAERLLFGMLLVGAIGLGLLFALGGRWEVRITPERVHVVPRTDGKMDWKAVDGFAWAAQSVGEGDEELGRGLFVRSGAKLLCIWPEATESEARQTLARIARKIPRAAEKCRDLRML